MTTQLDLCLPAISTSVRTVRNEVAELAADLGAEEDVVDDVRLCVSEAVTNVVRHAYTSPEGTLLVRADVVGDELVVVVRDRGIGMSRPGERHNGGHGFHILRQLTKLSVASSPREGTEVRMAFPLHARAHA
jgi:anti-sigma regulatory factor (Ser/Thr protein kinase)